MNEENIEIIPIDTEIEKFQKYLADHDRLIFSARFGDGKSYFLKKFIEKYKSVYKFIVIYPVNYQVADNKDIFEYIKRDILIQLLTHVDVTEVGFIDQYITPLWNYIKAEKYDIAQDILDMLPNLLGFGSGQLKILLKNIKKFNEHKEEQLNETPEERIENFLTAISGENGSIYEFDAITQIICSLIKKIKDEDNNKVVLVIEDLDRIDPAHIFRLLNIFSAHIDHERYTSDLGLTTMTNKFDADKILLVCHYDNIKYIYHHLYGDKTDFRGYISKFSSQVPFVYSLREKYKEKIFSWFDKELMQHRSVMELLIDMILDKTQNVSTKKDDTSEKQLNSLRWIKENLYKRNYNISDAVIKIDSHYRCRTTNINLLKLLDILNRFNISFSVFVALIIEKDKESFERFVGVSWLIEVESGIHLTYNRSNKCIYPAGDQYIDAHGVHCNINFADVPERDIVSLDIQKSIVFKYFPLYSGKSRRVFDNIFLLAKNLEQYLTNEQSIKKYNLETSNNNSFNIADFDL